MQAPLREQLDTHHRMKSQQKTQKASPNEPLKAAESNPRVAAEENLKYSNSQKHCKILYYNGVYDFQSLEGGEEIGKRRECKSSKVPAFISKVISVLAKIASCH